MPRRVTQVGIGLVALLTAACTTVEGRPVAAEVTTTTVAPATTTTSAPPTTTTTTPTTAPIPKPKGPKKVQVHAGSSLPMRSAYKMAYVQIVTIRGGEVAIIADWAAGSGGSFSCYNDCSLSAGDVVSISELSPGSVVSLNNLVLVVDTVSGSRAQVTVGTLH
ncbi:hypothetical protein [Labedaea rhizosphaerae]|uniref:Uncharacterized protein n=1 Tax=Labedaea rhizosphaerae TaxID=598644 RepID=A0A4R6SHG1_LABRH|nr:hypothetical protein [Labedaea rhizosphaerae]TDQ01063.1 hypothetical protein EV186_102930 [Labedaea rhizosphaerae]